MGINNQQYRVIIGTFNPAGCRYISGRHCNNIYNDFNAFALIMYLFIFHLCTLSDKSYCRNGQSQGHIQAKDSHGQVGNVCFAVTFFYFSDILCLYSVNDDGNTSRYKKIIGPW